MKIGSRKYKEISAGVSHSLALDIDGNLWAWGSNNRGKLGDGTNSNRFNPVQIGSSIYIAISAAADHSLAIDTDNKVWVWGINNWGQLGDGSLTDRRSPVNTNRPELNFTAISGYWSSFALNPEGLIWAWGANGHGTLGNGGSASRNTPAPVLICLPDCKGICINTCK